MYSCGRLPDVWQDGVGALSLAHVPQLSVDSSIVCGSTEVFIAPMHATRDATLQAKARLGKTALMDRYIVRGLALPAEHDHISL